MTMVRRPGDLAILAAVSLALSAVARPAGAKLVGATYDASASSTGSTEIALTSGTYTDPANPGFCVGPPLKCATTGAGMSGSFAFSSPTATTSDITFTFFGGTEFAAGTFSIDLSDFVTTDGEKISSIAYSSGALLDGDFTNVSWDGASAVFTGSTSDMFNGFGGVNIVFTATMSAVPEPATWAMMLIGFAGLGYAGCRRRRVAAV